MILSHVGISDIPSLAVGQTGQKYTDARGWEIYPADVTEPSSV